MTSLDSKHPRRTSAFTILELLIVITIIAVLVGLLIPVISIAKFKSRVLITGQRMEQILAALQGQGKEQGSTAYVLQRECALGGTAEFDLDPNNQAIPAGAAPWHQCFPAAAASTPNPLILAYPWGQSRLYWVREAWYGSGFSPALSLSDPGDPTMTTAQRDAWYAQWKQPEHHSISELCPTRSLQLLQRAGVLEVSSEAQAVTKLNDRGPNQRWNDAWGHPLIVAYAIYQPPACALGGRYTRDFYLREALAEYQSNRTLYVSVGAPGMTLDNSKFPGGSLATSSFATYADWAGTCADLWSGIIAGCTTGSQTDWDETSFARPPWKGNRVGDTTIGGKRIRAMLSTPIEIK